jgi:hypothetical protein
MLREEFISGRWPFQARYWVNLVTNLDLFTLSRFSTRKPEEVAVRNAAVSLVL